MTELSENDQKLGALVDIFVRQMAERKLDSYAPYDWQKDFHAAGVDNPERMLMAANRVGKTASAAAETTLHLTGDYDHLSRTMVYPAALAERRGRTRTRGSWCGRTAGRAAASPRR
jgi:hypothetical protein